MFSNFPDLFEFNLKIWMYPGIFYQLLFEWEIKNGAG